MHWSQSVSTSKFSLGRHSPSVPKKTWAIFLGPEFRDPFHLVKNQVEVFRCEAHISLLGMVISGWAATSMFESSWGGASKEKKARLCPSFHILACSLCFSMLFFSFSPSLLLFLSPFLFFSFPVLSLLSFYLPLCFLSHFFLPSPVVLLSLPLLPISLCPLSPSLPKSFLSVSLSLGKNKDLNIMKSINKLARDPTGRVNIFYLLIFSQAVVAGSYTASAQNNFPLTLGLHVCIQWLWIGAWSIRTMSCFCMAWELRMIF